MVLVAILLTMFRFRLNYTDILSITFIILIILDKFIIYHVGFQLSFAVTFGIILSKNWLYLQKQP